VALIEIRVATAPLAAFDALSEPWRAWRYSSQAFENPSDLIQAYPVPPGLCRRRHMSAQPFAKDRRDDHWKPPGPHFPWFVRRFKPIPLVPGRIGFERMKVRFHFGVSPGLRRIAPVQVSFLPWATEGNLLPNKVGGRQTVRCDPAHHQSLELQCRCGGVRPVLVMPLYAVLVRGYFLVAIMGSVFGVVAMVSTLGMALGPPIGSWLFD
jgi:hypothetical protein